MGRDHSGDLPAQAAACRDETGAEFCALLQRFRPARDRTSAEGEG